VSDFPPTVIIVHPKERRSKCTVRPLRGREGFVFHKYPNVSVDSPEDYVRLGLGGPLLSTADADRGLLILDGTWRLAEKMEQDVRDMPLRSLPRVQTAYPRVSKMHDDPTGGLATIEAIYVAYYLLGRETEHLLEGYRWADEFLQRNRDLWVEPPGC